MSKKEGHSEMNGLGYVLFTLILSCYSDSHSKQKVPFQLFPIPLFVAECYFDLPDLPITI